MILGNELVLAAGLPSVYVMKNFVMKFGTLISIQDSPSDLAKILAVRQLTSQYRTCNRVKGNKKTIKLTLNDTALSLFVLMVA